MISSAAARWVDARADPSIGGRPMQVQLDGHDVAGGRAAVALHPQPRRWPRRVHRGVESRRWSLVSTYLRSISGASKFWPATRFAWALPSGGILILVASERPFPHRQPVPVLTGREPRRGRRPRPCPGHPQGHGAGPDGRAGGEDVIDDDDPPPAIVGVASWATMNASPTFVARAPRPSAVLRGGCRSASKGPHDR